MRASELDPELRTVVEELDALGLPDWIDLVTSATCRADGGNVK